MMIITMTTAFDLRPQSNNNYPLLLSTTRIRIRSYPQPPCLLSNNNKGINNYRSRRRGKQQLYMGGYYAEDLTNDNIDNNYDNEDRSKTHMIFGVRCIEKEKSFLIPTTTKTETARTDTIEVTVTGLQPLLKDDDDDDEDDSVVLREDDNDNDDDDFVSILLEQVNRSLVQKQQKLRVLEIGADPIFSLALSKLISSAISSTGTGTDDTGDVTHSVTIYHPDERRLRVLDHAYQFFNEIRSKKCSFQTVPLEKDKPLNIDSDSNNDNAIHVNCDSWIVFTNAKLVSTRLDAVMTIFGAKSIMANNNNHRVFVPSSIISNEQLKRYNYHEVTMGSSSNNNDKIGDDIDSSVVLEILNSK
jgi:hypothetical protein